MGDKARARSTLAMKPSDEVAQAVAEEIAPRDYQYWPERGMAALARAIFNARQEGYDAGYVDAIAWLDEFAQELEQRADRLDRKRAAAGKAFALREIAAELRERAKEER